MERRPPQRSAPAWVDRDVDLPGRGRMSVRSVQGPPGAPTLALLHGLAATGRLNWFTAQSALAECYNLLIVDHRGHGRGIRTRHFRLADCADDVIALADVLGVESLVAVGYSMGGPIAKLCWSRHPDRVRGLVLCATARHFMRPDVQGVASAVFPGMVVAARLVPRLFRDRIVAGMLAGVPPGEQRERVRREFAGGDPATILQATRAVIRFTSHDWVSNIDVPTAVLVMTRDRLVPASRQYKLARAIEGARVFEVDGDHLACVRVPERFVPALVAACDWVLSQSKDASGQTAPSVVRAPHAAQRD